MNNLSWLLYLADIVPSFVNTLAFLSAIALLITSVLLGIGSFGAEDRDYDRPDFVAARRIGKFSILFFALIILSRLVPNEPQTYYAIAASEMGEEVIKSPLVSKTGKALEHWLDKQLKDIPEEAVNQVK